MAGGGHPDASASLREQLEHLDEVDLTLPTGSRPHPPLRADSATPLVSSASLLQQPAPISTTSAQQLHQYQQDPSEGNRVLAGAASRSLSNPLRRPQSQQQQPLPAASPRDGALSPTSPLSPTARVRFSDELVRARPLPPQYEAPPPPPSPTHRRRPNLQLETELYTIESNVAMGGGHPVDGSSRLRGDGPRDADRPVSAASSIVESPVSLTRPRTHFAGLDENVKSAMAETNATLAHYKAWAARQREAQRQFMEGPMGRLKARSNAFYRRWVIEGLLRRKPIPPSKDGRHIPLDPGAARRRPFKDERTGKPYVSNSIRSSRYTMYDFVPRQLIFQFGKLANFYFLLIGIMQMIPGLSTTGTYTTIGPLLAFVAISMGKEGYDDYRRYRLDQSENKSRVLVLDPARPGDEDDTQRRGLFGRWFGRKRADLGPEAGTTEMERMGTGAEKRKMWTNIAWADLRVGDVIRLKRDENVPADIVLLHATGPNEVAFIDTMALDGETNLKNKQACPELAKHCRTVAGMAACNATIVTEDPNLDLYNFEGRVTIDGETKPLTTNQVVYRGSTIRNTAQAIGLVINSGEECKIRMNANKNVRAKAPEMQFLVNRIVVVLVLFVLFLSFGLTIGYHLWHRHYEKHAWYLENATVPFKQIIIGFIIEFNTLIPLSLYVSLEMIKLGQLYLLHDVEMYDEVTNTPMTANTTTILENLGQVSYVFSDKTGTLTENLMRFRKLSVAGTAWLHDMDVQRDAEDQERKRMMSRARRTKRKQGSEASTMREAILPKKPEPVEESLIGGGPQDLPQHRSSGLWKSSARPAMAQPELNTQDLIRYVRQKPHTPFSRKARQFILCVALCHTCLPEKGEDGEYSFQAASPDELALVEAARDLGYLLVDRAAQSIELQFQDFDGTTTTEKYEVLDVIEFSSKRKRMSIIIRMPDGRICIFVKGADSVILPRLRQNHLAIQKASAVERRASYRRSMEQEIAMRRRSVQSIRRDSKQLARAATTMSQMRGSLRRGSHGGSASLRRSGTALTDEVDFWLTRRETEDLGQTDGVASPYHTPSPQAIRRSQSIEPSMAAMVDDQYDGLVDETLAVDDAAVFEKCFQHIDDFASEGLRTLIFAYRYLEEDDYKKWKSMYQEATTCLIDRQQRIEEVAEMIEQDFDLAGASAIEDKLQQGVPDTIDKLRRANIHVWMLTGDKRETAINIAHSARICKPFSEIYILDATEGDLQEKIASTLVDVGRGMVPHSVVVIDGHTLGVVEEDESLRILLFDLVARVDSVICCRASPAQKATLVRCIRKKVPNAVTLAIGDGANDIAMIQASHVGIGISGREGRQAARISDYSIAQFRFLQRLLFVHGRWNYIRTAKYILGTFWKEIVFYLVQAQYQKFNGYTGTSLYEPTSLTVFNTLFTSLPVILLGIFEKDLAAETLLAVPELYTYGQRNKGFSFVKWVAWMAVGVAESFIIFKTMYTVYQASLGVIETSLFAMGSLAFTVCVIFINVKMLVLELHNRTIVSFLGLFISISGWFVWNMFLGAIYKKNPGPYMVRNAFMQEFGRSAVWWLTGIATLAALVIFELVLSGVRRFFWPTDQDLMQEIEKLPGVLDVMGEHAAGTAERGEVGVGTGPEYFAPGGKDVKGAGADTASVRTASTTLSSAEPDFESWQWERERERERERGVTSRSGPSSVRNSRLVEDYIPPPFTPPAEEERENPMDHVRQAQEQVPTRTLVDAGPDSGPYQDTTAGQFVGQRSFQLRDPPVGRSG